LCRGKRVARAIGKSVARQGVRRDAEPIQVKSVILCCREKPLAMFRAARTPNRHRWSGREYRGDGRTVVKELGKLPP
jgi:hypothetical protein